MLLTGQFALTEDRRGRKQGAGYRKQGAGDRNTRIGRSQRLKISDHIFDLREPALTKEGFVRRSSIDCSAIFDPLVCSSIKNTKKIIPEITIIGLVNTASSLCFANRPDA